MTETVGYDAITSTPRWRISPAILVWLSLGIASTSAASGASTLRVELVALLSVALGIGAFWRHGGGRITATGIYMLAFAVFVGGAGLMAVADDQFVIDEWFWRATIIMYFTQVLTYYLFNSYPEDRVDIAAPHGAADPGVTGWGVTVGAFLVITGAVSHAILPDNTLVDAAPIVGITLLATALWRHKGGGIGAWRLITVLCAFAFYAFYIFEGYGRLNLVDTALAIALAAAHRWRGRRLKSLMIAVLPAAMLYLAGHRTNFMSQVNPEGPAVTGFESAIRPLLTFARLLEMLDVNRLPPAWGETFAVSSVALVPRALWESKPIGFGAELAFLFYPRYAVRGHSELALFAGEWLWNFAWIGLILMVPAAGLLLRLLDQWVLRKPQVPIRDTRDLLSLVAVFTAVSGVVDLFWGGTFTYMSRSGARLLVLAILALLVAYRPRRRHSTNALSLKRSARVQGGRL